MKALEQKRFILSHHNWQKLLNATHSPPFPSSSLAVVAKQAEQVADNIGYVSVICFFSAMFCFPPCLLNHHVHCFPIPL